tara:strand:+ start:273 stop:1181 length:909 start_codon:yes stop_codon:yes gene_type:complete
VNHQQLTTFCTVLGEGSMTAAADKLFLTQPAVSQQIRNLEEDLGVNLLERGVRKVKPTLQGQLLFDYARKILHLTQQAEVAIQTMSQELSGNLRIGTQNSIGLFLISPIVGLFLKHNSRLNIKLIYGTPESIIDEMKKGEIDIAILPDTQVEFGQSVDDQYESKFLLKDEMWLVGTGKDPSLPKTISMNQFTSRPIIYYSEMYNAFRKQLENKLEETNAQFIPVFEADNVGTLKRVIESGLGWGFLPSFSIRKQVRTGRLSHVMVEDLMFAVNINLYSKKTAESRKMSEVFYRALYQQTLNQ